MFDDAVTEVIPHAIATVFEGDHAAGTEAVEATLSAVAQFAAHGERVTNVSATFAAAAAAGAEPELPLGIPAKEVLFVDGKGARIDGRQLHKFPPQRTTGIEHG